jgi:hypothetical protein
LRPHIFELNDGKAVIIQRPRNRKMVTNFSNNPNEPERYDSQPGPAEETGSSLESFVHTRTQILNTKLEVLAAEIYLRLHIRTGNLERIADEKLRVGYLLTDLTRRANYLVREHREKAPFYQQWFDLEKERRTEDVECWRDVVMVMRDFLMAWEAHEQAKAKAIFLQT